MIEYDDEEDLKADERLEIFCDLLNQIERRPDAEIVLARACEILRILADGSVEETDLWPSEIAC